VAKARALNMHTARLATSGSYLDVPEPQGDAREGDGTPQIDALMIFKRERDLMYMGPEMQALHTLETAPNASAEQGGPKTCDTVAHHHHQSIQFEL